MTVKLGIAAVRDAVYRQVQGAGSRDAAQPSTRLLGQMFHQSFARLFGDDPQLAWQPLLAGTTPDPEEWTRRLAAHLYERILGPRLGREQARLHGAGTEVLACWQAARAMCHWVAHLLCTAGPANGAGGGLGLVLQPEEPMSLRLRVRSWREPVELSGVADLVLTLPGRPGWCVVELKLGQNCPEADLAQACLYHLILSARRPDASGAMALVGFRPEREELFFDAARLASAQSRLLPLIGRLAGVLPGRGGGSAADPASPPSQPASPRIHDAAQRLVAIFAEYGKGIALAGEPVAGPSFIRYPIRLAHGVRLAAAQKTVRELQHRLGLAEPPLLHMAEGSVVIDLQRPDRRPVPFAAIRDQLPLRETSAGCSRVLLGIDLDGRLRYADLAEPENAHILVAGTTGSGKSEWLRSALAGLLLCNTPETLRLVLIDPKRNAFNDLRGSPFLFNPQALVYPDERSVSDLLADLGDEMERRYRLLQQTGADSRDQFIGPGREPMARILCVCDEYCDLVNRGKEERRAVEEQIFRLGAKARAAGIHLVIATQQPSRQVIRGALDANIPARVGLKMNRDIESVMLLGARGAENLLGAGDLLFKDIGEPLRLQSPLLAAQERQRIFGAGRRP